jgi:hypothetical protein
MRVRAALGFVFLLAATAAAQQPSPAPPSPAPLQTPPAAAADPVAPAAPVVPAVAASDKRILGVIPNYRTTESSLPFEPLSAKQKMTIAAKDSFDWPLFLTGAAFAGVDQIENQNPSFGQGVQGYAKRYGTSYGDLMIGNMMAEGIWPAILKEDPRYFRLGAGHLAHRLGYAATRIFVTRMDTGGWRFNVSELAGNAVATAIANAYYPDGRDVRDNVQRLATQMATDSVSNVLKEFWPDIKRKAFKRGPAAGDGGAAGK